MNSLSNSAATANHLQRLFDVGTKRQIVVADLSYIRVNHRWNYLYVLLIYLIDRLPVIVSVSIKRQI
ncbi:hypothetical protein [Snodgrassella alvi]|uniref:Transposase n=1 Tax=Snodgrassella alvi TaxID=1196083 RepID=A0A2N9XTA4_9NEIS|nr:hypothetical protein [Snodgrassella alvi]PIT52467.1 hypothetical protein BHC49_13510 [Snodgrassella alvi]